MYFFLLTWKTCYNILLLCKLSKYLVEIWRYSFFMHVQLKQVRYSCHWYIVWVRYFLRLSIEEWIFSFFIWCQNVLITQIAFSLCKSYIFITKVINKKVMTGSCPTFWTKFTINGKNRNGKNTFSRHNTNWPRVFHRAQYSDLFCSSFIPNKSKITTCKCIIFRW